MAFVDSGVREGICPTKCLYRRAENASRRRRFEAFAVLLCPPLRSLVLVLIVAAPGLAL